MQWINHFKSIWKGTLFYGETIIKEYIQGNRINAIRQYTFNDWCDLGGLEFDFAVMKVNTPIDIIENDGVYHYRVIYKRGINSLVEY